MCIATEPFSNTGKYRAVFFDGPQSDRDQDGEEIPAWVVYVGDSEAEPTSTIHTLHHFINPPSCSPARWRPTATLSSSTKPAPLDL
jgi:hypothetical protein